MIEWLQNTTGALGDPEAWQSFRRVVTLFAVAEGWQYAAITFAFWIVLHVLLRKRMAHRLISKWPRRGDVQRELVYSVSSLVLYAAGSAAILAMLAAGRIEIYSEPLKHGLAWLLLSLPVLIFWQDLCIYWTHRLMHTRWMFRHVHGVHHRSRSPSPWAAYAMHPVEAIANGGLPLAALAVVPVQEHVLALFVLHQVIRNAYGHAAIECLPQRFVRHRFWGQLTTTTHHHLHHEMTRGNYGLWFTWCDRVFGTELANYQQRFEAVTAPRAALPSPAEPPAEAVA